MDIATLVGIVVGLGAIGGSILLQQQKQVLALQVLYRRQALQLFLEECLPPYL